MASKVFVGNLDFNTTREDLEALMSQAGQVKDVYLPTDRETRRPRGFAFVEYSSDEEAAAAIEKFNGHELGGRQLRVNASRCHCTSAPSSKCAIHARRVGVSSEDSATDRSAASATP